MDFSLTTVFVMPSGGTVATTGGTGDLTPGKIGIFKKSQSAVATSSDTQVIIAQGRSAGEMLSTSKKSALIDENEIVQYRKYAAVTSAVQKQITVDDFTVHCGDEFNLSVRIFENYLDAIHNPKIGLVKTWTIPAAPCCPCDGDTDPCEVLDPEAMVDQLVALINADNSVKNYIVASKTGTGATTALVITGVAQPAEKYNATSTKNPYTDPNVVDFYVYATKNAPTSYDQEVLDKCDSVATVEVTQNITYPRGSAHEVNTVEKQYYSYQTSKFKHLCDDEDFNVGFVSLVDPTAWYDEYLIKFRNKFGNAAWNPAQEMDNTVRIFVKTGTDSNAFATALGAILGANEINNEY